MCGFSVLAGDLNSIRFNHLKKMNAAIKNRGPDEEGFALFAGSGEVFNWAAGEQSSQSRSEFDALDSFDVCFAHQRLSIIDLSSGGRQPMTSDDGRYWIVYNGEIYNYLELRAELKLVGMNFKSDSDTEVVLRSFQCWGREAFDRFNGMFSFAIYDRLEKKLTCVRDRFGIKPLYYFEMSSGAIAIASEIKQFTFLPSWAAKLDGQAAYDFLTWSLSDHADMTFFKNVRQIRGGEILEVDLRKGAWSKKITRWYNLKPRIEKIDYIEAFRSLFFDSIRLRLRSDVEVGSCLSGGLDSSSIVLAASQLMDSNRKLKAFSAFSNYQEFDESRFAIEVQEKSGSHLYSTVPTSDHLIGSFDELIWTQDEPFGSSSIFAQWCVFKKAHEHKIKVMLDGQGADEILGGYRTFLYRCIAEHLSSGRLGKFAVELGMISKNHNLPWSDIAKNVANALFPRVMQDLNVRALIGQSVGNSNLFSSKALGASKRDPFLELGARNHGMNSLSLSMVKATNLPMLLHWEDRNSMAHSVESRLPFLDFRLVELMLGMPPDLKVNRGTTKWVLRQGLKDMLPISLQHRHSKLGFATPEVYWVTKEHRGTFLKLLNESREQLGGVLSKSAFEHALMTINGERPFSNLPWRVVCFSRWMKKFEVGLP